MYVKTTASRVPCGLHRLGTKERTNEKAIYRDFTNVNTEPGNRKSVRENSESTKIFVGEVTPKSQPHVVRKTLLYHSSRYFTAALSQHFHEGRTGTLQFPPDNTQPWSLFLFWLYRGEVRRERPEDHAHDYWIALTHAYVFGDKHKLPSFQSAVSLAFMKTLENSPINKETMAAIVGLIGMVCRCRS